VVLDEIVHGINCCVEVMVKHFWPGDNAVQDRMKWSSCPAQYTTVEGLIDPVAELAVLAEDDSTPAPFDMGMAAWLLLLDDRLLDDLLEDDVSVLEVALVAAAALSR